MIKIVQYLPKHKTKKYNKRELSQVDKITIHHSATKQGSPQAFGRYHVDTNGWPGIGYHLVIDKEGNSFQTNEFDTVSYHVAGHNTSAIGICLVGNFDEERPTEQQLASLERDICEIRELVGKELKVFGHKEFSPKTCPGKNFNLEYFKSI